MFLTNLKFSSLQTVFQLEKPSKPIGSANADLQYVTFTIQDPISEQLWRPGTNMSVCDSHASATDKLTFSKIERNTCLVVGTFHNLQERDHLITDSSHAVQLSILVYSVCKSPAFYIMRWAPPITDGYMHIMQQGVKCAP